MENNRSLWILLAEKQTHLVNFYNPSKHQNGIFRLL